LVKLVLIKLGVSMGAFSDLDEKIEKGKENVKDGWRDLTDDR
jgi:hypothetical protein